ncbi:wall-associated receptor kinase 3-like [Eucalyptus grandis]|uniref:wall-associated receptor kinase 3-like n=1 Tax=Eucalyptus grandis TaxID=71139 RepID=UPI00192E93AC|nr:wall-associated receptor kinase 3-like [Eucalyptus grandis]
MSSSTNYNSVGNFSSCGSAFVVNQESFNISDYKLPVPADMRKEVFSRVVLDWVVERDLTCEETQSNRSSYACGANSFCSDFRNVGYRCFREAGYTGNPYASPQSPGCQVIIIAAFFLITIGAFVLDTWSRRSKEKNFRQNGVVLLKHQRVKIFTKAELTKATNHYDDVNKLGKGRFGSAYRGIIARDTVIAIKKPKDVRKSLVKGDFQHELEIVMQINHKNMVKLDALKIATKATLALEYMHSCVEPPIIHGDIKLVNILLDQSYSINISDFGTSVLISPKRSHVVANEIQGTLGYIDPEYLTTGILIAKSDVYSFGVVFVELLTGKKPTSFVTKSRESIGIIIYFNSFVKDRTLSNVISFKPASEDAMERGGMVAEIDVK